MSPRDVQALRSRCWHSLSPTTAAVAKISLAQLQQFVGGTFYLDAPQCEALARYLGVELKDAASA
jgi:hypothetical protein